MPRFSSLDHVPAETRRTLRDRFKRFLRAHGEAIEPTRGRLLHDELLLRLLLNLRVEFESDLEKAKATYAAALAQNPGEPTFDEVIAAGWIRVVAGRISTPFEVAREAMRRSTGPMTALAALLKKRFEHRFVLNDTALNDTELSPLVAEVKEGEPRVFNLRSQDSRWVAARLWDRCLSSVTDRSSELRLWVDRWRLIGAPSLIPTQAWADDAASAFLQTAISVLERELSLVGWQDIRNGFMTQLALGYGKAPSDMERHVSAVPKTLIDRALWLQDFRLERAVTGTLGIHDDVFGIVRILLGEVAAQGNAQAPHWLAQRLLELALERAELFLIILFQIRQRPELLADLVLYPPTSGLACLLVAQWQSMAASAWDREVTNRDDETAKKIAFADAVSVMGHFLEKGSLSPEEAAALLRFLYKDGKPAPAEEYDNRESMVGILRAELARQSPEIQQAIFAELAPAMPQEGVGTPSFAAALDILATGELTQSVDPKPLLEAYISTIAAGHYSLSAHGIGDSAAASLVEVAIRAPEDLRKKFFRPIDMPARVAAAAAPDANSYTINDETARSIRAHVRVLCRAAARLESAPDDLTDALTNAVRIGAVSHAEKGRVAAFAARFETDPYRGRHDRPIAADLGAALGFLSGDAKEKFFAAILEIDEPMVLAQLLGYAPSAVRDRIKGRIAAITPSEAGDTRSLPEAQARIDALLSAGLADSAAKFIEAEPELETLGKVPGREVMRLRAALALKLLRRDWAGIAATVPPTGLGDQEKDAAIEAISFFNALAAMHDPAGDREGAVQTFRQLQSRHPQVASYTINLVAAQITSLLGNDLFAQLHGQALVRGRQVLVEVEQAMPRLRVIAAPEKETFEANKALLLLALGQPDRAVEVLSTLRGQRLRERVIAYSAIALARMGRVSEAVATLDQADDELGKTEIVSAARAHIESGAHFAAIANLSPENDPISLIKQAFWDFSQLDHFRQAQVSAESFESLAIKHVRGAAETLATLVPTMKEDPREDDLNKQIGALLHSRVLSPLGWTVPDQTQGGYTAKGGPGERDLIIEKNGSLLAIVEALKCDRPLSHKAMRDDLTRHFQKLLGYGQCDLYFHLTYSYLQKTADILDYLRATAKKDVPPAHIFIGYEEIPGGRPAGFIGRYKTDSAEVAVVFLVLDMEQHAQRQAGKIGRAS
jgi:hypothetical protein